MEQKRRDFTDLRSHFLSNEPAREPPLSRLQQHLAQLLTAQDPPPTSHPFFPDDISRTRQILCRKRVDDALPLLPRLSAHHQALKTLAEQCIKKYERAPRLPTIADAMRIATAASHDPTLAPLARIDLLTLKARFIGSPNNGILQPRRGPFVHRMRLCPDRVLWAIKGIGKDAQVRLIETRG